MTETAPAPRVRRWVTTVPALLVGAAAAGILWVIDEVALFLEHVWWHVVPAILGVDPDGGWWIFAILTLTGILIGLVRWLVPGRGGIDSATVEMAQPPQPLRVLPGIALAAILMLAGGVSLGPEAPVIAIVLSLTVWLLAQRWRLMAPQEAGMIAIAGTIGALFGTPVAAALLLTSAFAAIPGAGALWDRLFHPLAAAATGALVTHMLGGGITALPGFGSGGGPDLDDVLWGAVIACVAAALGVLGAWALPPAHRALRRWLRHPFLIPAVGGVILGILGAIGGPLTLFKGLEQGAELVAQAGTITVGTAALIVAIKVVALVVSAAAAFPGGRIFPAVFIGLAVGVLGEALIPGLSLSAACACGVLGFTVAASRDGWLGLFAAIAIVGDIALMPILCVIVLPVWIIVSKGPEMIVHAKPAGP